MSENINKKKFYVVMQSMLYDDSSSPHAVFTNKDKAEAYCKLMNELEDDYNYYAIDCNCLDDYDTSKKIVPYYSYYIGKEQDLSLEECFQHDYWLIRDYLIDNSLMPLDKLLKMEVSDTSTTQWGTPAHKNILEYVKRFDLTKAVEICNLPDNRYNNEGELEKRIYNGDLDIDETDDYIQVYSVESFDKAKQEAMKLYENWKSKQSL